MLMYGRDLISLVNFAAENLSPEGVQALIAQSTLLQQNRLYKAVCFSVYIEQQIQL